MKPETHPYFMQLQKKRKRMTVARKTILKIFLDAQKPLSVSEVLHLLLKNRISVNKTTAYREVDFLVAHEMIEKVSLQTKEAYYEIKSIHHHHLVCQNCQKVEEVELKNFEKELFQYEKKLSREKKFLSVNHSLQFFGMCSRCRE